MPNGRKHDNPISDILIWDMKPFNDEIDALIREIVDIAGDVSPFDADDDLTMLAFAAEADPSLQPELQRRLVILRGQLRSSR